MKSVLLVLKEMWTNRERILRLARYERKAKNSDTFLGRAWDILNPLFQIGVYWLVFGLGLKVRSDQDNIPYVIWMISGLIPWFCINDSMAGASRVISGSASIIKNVCIPMSIIPAKNVVSYFLEHLWTMLLLFAMIFLYGIQPSLYMLQILYYMFCMLAFLLAFCLFASSIGAVVKDFHSIVGPVIHLMFYVSNVITPIDNFSSELLKKLLKLNPVTYITYGYRNSLLYHIGFWESPWHTLAFWTITLVLLFAGCFLHMRTRERFVDLL